MNCLYTKEDFQRPNLDGLSFDAIPHRFREWLERPSKEEHEAIFSPN